jgi:hypothetical protein
MVATLGEAYDHGWRITLRCGWGRREGLKSVRGCNAALSADLGTLVWTRGRDFPGPARIAPEMPAVRIAAGASGFSPPAQPTRMRA